MQKIGFIMEQILGHKTHAMNLQEVACSLENVMPNFAPVPLTASVWMKVPYVKNDLMTRIGIEGRRELVRLRKQTDVNFLHTQNVAIFSSDLMNQTPAIVSLDATPSQWFELNQPYFKVPEKISWRERAKMGVLKTTRLKHKLLEKSLCSASLLVTWSEWAKEGVVRDFKISPERIYVIPPGVSTALFKPGPHKKYLDVVKVLFVGGDFVRKGGDLLLEWARTTSASNWELHLVTKEPLQNLPANIFVYNNISNNSDELLKLYQESDLFVLPTNADCLPLVSLEATASGLPIVASRIAAIPEVVSEGVNGILIKPGSLTELTGALDSLIADHTTRTKMGENAREIAMSRFSLNKTYGGLVDLVRSVA
ncbi:MAG: glycosyltransferase family 4 protein [Armatimonadaceae bacterium]